MSKALVLLDAQIYYQDLPLIQSSLIRGGNICLVRSALHFDPCRLHFHRISPSFSRASMQVLTTT